MTDAGLGEMNDIKVYTHMHTHTHAYTHTHTHTQHTHTTHTHTTHTYTHKCTHTHTHTHTTHTLIKLSCNCPFSSVTGAIRWSKPAPCGQDKGSLLTPPHIPTHYTRGHMHTRSHTPYLHLSKHSCHSATLSQSTNWTKERNR